MKILYIAIVVLASCSNGDGDGPTKGTNKIAPEPNDTSKGMQVDSIYLPQDSIRLYGLEADDTITLFDNGWVSVDSNFIIK